MTQPTGLFEILNKIKTKPGLYLGKPSVSDLFIFVAGYKTARRELGIEPNEAETQFYREFPEFVQNTYQIKTANSWAKIIMLSCHDEKEGFQIFFELLDNFIAQEITTSFKGSSLYDSHQVKT
ncbi:MAG: hypothetical protein AB4058_03105 [Microcystaceae cyanobacterium]